MSRRLVNRCQRFGDVGCLFPQDIPIRWWLPRKTFEVKWGKTSEDWNLRTSRSWWRVVL